MTSLIVMNRNNNNHVSDSGDDDSSTSSRPARCVISSSAAQTASALFRTLSNNTSNAAAGAGAGAAAAIVDGTQLMNHWDIYCHLPNSDDWSLGGYIKVYDKLSIAEHAIALCECIPDNLIRYCMLFVMRHGVSPMWEDPRNKNGGKFSFKIVNKNVPEIWTAVFLALVGANLCRQPQHYANVMGVTISPKKNFCILKIWMTDCSLQDVTIFNDIAGLVKQKCLFRQHTPADA